MLLIEKLNLLIVFDVAYIKPSIHTMYAYIYYIACKLNLV